MTMFFRIRGLTFGAAGIVGGLTLLTANGASAQALNQIEVPTYGGLPDRYPAQGVRVGAFIVNPSVALHTGYHDNIFLTKSATKSDIRNDVSPSIGVKSDWSRHAVGFSAGGTMGRFRDNPNENFDDYDLSANGKLDIVRDTTATLVVGRRRGHEDRGSPNFTAGREPTVYYVDKVEPALSTKLNRLSALATLTVEDYHYAAQATDTFETRKNDRDRMETKLRLRGGYEFSPGYTAFVQGTLNKRDYDQIRDRNGLQRDSKGYRADAGVAFELTRLLIGEVYGGYFKQEYDETTFKDPSGLAFGASLAWSVTALTTVKADVSNSVEEATSATTSGIVTTSYKLGVTHELLERLALTAAAAYKTENYEGGSSRSDQTRSFGAGSKYYFNSLVNLGLSARQDTKESSLDSDGYRSRIVILALGITR